MTVYILTHADSSDYYGTTTTDLGVYSTHEGAIAALELVRARGKLVGGLFDRTTHSGIESDRWFFISPEVVDQLPAEVTG